MAECLDRPGVSFVFEIVCFNGCDFHHNKLPRLDLM